MKGRRCEDTMSGVEVSQRNCTLTPERDKSSPRGSKKRPFWECGVEGLTFDKKGIFFKVKDRINKSMNCVKPNIKNPQCREIVSGQDDSLMKVVNERGEAKFKPLGGYGTNSCIPDGTECTKVSPSETFVFWPQPGWPYKEYTDTIWETTCINTVETWAPEGMQPPGFRQRNGLLWHKGSFTHPVGLREDTFTT